MAHPARSEQERPSELRHRVLRAATRLFAERGYAGTSVREVVEAAGCTKPALYYHFAGKEALFIEALRAQVEGLDARLQRAYEGAGPVRRRLTEAVRAVARYARSAPHGMLLLYRASRQPEEGQPSFDFAPVQEAPLAMARSLFEEALEKGEIRPDVDLDDALLALQGLVDLKCCAFISGTGPLPDDFPERATALIFDGVGT